MFVVKKGKTNCWRITEKCTGTGNGGGGCKAWLNINKDDVFRTYIIFKKNPIKRLYFYTFKCPICGTKTDIFRLKVPYQIKVLSCQYNSREKERIQYP